MAYLVTSVAVTRLIDETHWNKQFADLARRHSLVDELLRILVVAAATGDGSRAVDPAPILAEIQRGDVALEAEKRMRYHWRFYERAIRRLDQKDYPVTNRPQPDWVFTTSQMVVWSRTSSRSIPAFRTNS